MAHLEVLPRTTVEKWQMPDPVAVGAVTVALSPELLRPVDPEPYG